MGFGVTKETWFPDVARTGADYKLSEGLAPLARHQSDITLVQGCSNQFTNEAHWGSTFWLTGANRYSVPGQNMANSISADQVVAEQIGQRHPLSPRIQLNGSESAGSRARTFAELGSGAANLLVAKTIRFRFFTSSSHPMTCHWNNAKPPSPKTVASWTLSSLEARRVQRGLSKTDTDKLDEYFQGVRDIETRLNKDEAWLDVPKAKAPLDEPGPGLKGKAEIEIMQDLIVAALQTDSTRSY